jgi:RNA polymerase sigma-70 factor (ECF subfamily)
VEGGADEVAVVRSGGAAEFAHLAERHRRELRVHCYRMMGSYADAEDLVQETLLRAWRKRADFAGRSTFRAWLYRIATNACLDALDSPARRREVVAAADSGGGPADHAAAELPWLQPIPDSALDSGDADSPEGVTIARETVELAFLAAIQHLPARQRAVLILRDAAGLPAADTAAALDMSVASVKSALQRARATLRDRLPERRSEWARSVRPSAEERALLDRYVEASSRADLPALTALLRADARQAMPPAHLVFDGRAAILGMWSAALADPVWGAWHCVPLTANRQPACATYARRAGAELFTAVNVDVLRIEGGAIAEITTFGPEVLPAFGLPLEAAPADLPV